MSSLVFKYFIKLIISAAHCINEEKLIQLGYTLSVVRLGEHNQATYFDYDEHGKRTRTIDIPIEQRIPHPNYNRHRSLHDIALLRLKYTVRFTDSIRPICLPLDQFHNKNYNNFPLSIVGWGKTEKGKHVFFYFIVHTL